MTNRHITGFKTNIVAEGLIFIGLTQILLKIIRPSSGEKVYRITETLGATGAGVVARARVLRPVARACSSGVPEGGCSVVDVHAVANTGRETEPRTAKKARIHDYPGFIGL